MTEQEHELNARLPGARESTTTHMFTLKDIVQVALDVGGKIDAPHWARTSGCVTRTGHQREGLDLYAHTAKGRQCAKDWWYHVRLADAALTTWDEDEVLVSADDADDNLFAGRYGIQSEE